MDDNRLNPRSRSESIGSSVDLLIDRMAEQELEEGQLQGSPFTIHHEGDNFNTDSSVGMENLDGHDGLDKFDDTL